MISPDGAIRDPKDLNLLQIVALNIVATMSIFAFALAFGLSFLMALLGAWVAGGAATLGLAAAISHFRPRDRSVAVRPTDGPALVPSNISDPFQFWEADRLMELDHAQNRAGSGAHEGSHPQDARLDATSARSRQARSRRGAG